MAQVKKPQPSTRKARKPTTSSSSTSSSKSRSKDLKRPPPKQVKTKRTTHPSKAVTSTTLKSKKKPRYTDAQLNLPAINGIIPAVAHVKTGKGTGKKKDKVYVDDTESMMTILAMVNAEKEGMIESKVMKARQLEEIREARRKEAEKRAEGKRGKFEEVKDGLKRKVKGSGKGKEGLADTEAEKIGGKVKKRKSVSFA